jgi:YfiH family protein
VSFHWDGDHLAGDLGPGARALFSTRRGGVSGGPYASLDLGRGDPALPVDDPAAVAENRRRLQAAAAGTRSLRLAHQPHGAVIATDADPRTDADGQVTAQPGVGATVLVADCLPVALAGPGGVAMLHAGWRGLSSGVLENGVAALGGATTALVGPGIGVCCFQVGDEVRAAFADHPGARRGDHLDLKLIARRRLQAAGVEHVHDCGLCTHCEPGLFFSHRRDGGRTGRQGGVAWLS